MHIESASSTQTNVEASRVGVVLAAALLGLTLIFIAGFAEVSVLHNAAHDTRHSAGFPCH